MAIGLQRALFLAPVAVLAGALASCDAVKRSGAPGAPSVKTRAVAPDKDQPHWHYEGATGPASWGKLAAAWSACGEGRAQSPIDIGNAVRRTLPELKAALKPAQLRIIHQEHTADVVNTGHAIQVNYVDGETLTVGDESFRLLQFHFHNPSEHTIAGKRFPMEMHLVHRSTEGKLAVIAVLMTQGRRNAALDAVLPHLPQRKGAEYHLEHVKVDVSDLLPAERTSYRYDGSLTTPPCTERVKWFVMSMPVEASTEQIERFRTVLAGNNRPLQPANGRVVLTDRVGATVTPH